MKQFTRILSTILAVQFFASQVVLANKIETSFYLQKELLKNLNIKQVSKGSSQSTLLIIEDVHQNKEAQTHIAEALIAIGAEEGLKPVLVGLEGASGPFIFDRFRAVPEKNLTQEVVNEFFEKGELGGPSYVGFSPKKKQSRGLSFWGIEDPELYAQNVRAYKNVSNIKTKVQADLNEQKKINDVHKDILLNPELKKFDALVEQYRKDNISLGVFLESISQYETASFPVSLELFLAAFDLEGKVDFKKAEKERRWFLTRVSQTLSDSQAKKLMELGFGIQNGSGNYTDFYQYLKELSDQNKVDLSQTPHFESYIQYILLSQQIKSEDLLTDLDFAQNEIYQNLVKTEKEKELIAQSKQLFLTQKLIDFSLTPKEWAAYNKQGGQLGSFESFYEVAERRNHAFIQNLLSRESDGEDVKVLISGGFHTHGLKEILKEKNQSFVVASPKITKINKDDKHYLSIFDRESTPLEELFKGQRLFLKNEVPGALKPIRSNAKNPVPSLTMNVIKRAFENGRLTEKMKNWGSLFLGKPFASSLKVVRSWGKTILEFQFGNHRVSQGEQTVSVEKMTEPLRWNQILTTGFVLLSVAFVAVWLLTPTSHSLEVRMLATAGSLFFIPDSVYATLKRIWERKQLVVIVGAGPAGLRMARDLLLENRFRVVMIDQMPIPGGKGVFGIPMTKQNLKKNLWEEQKDVMNHPDLIFVGNARIGAPDSSPSDIDQWLLEAQKNNVPIIQARGAQMSRGLGIPGEDAKGVISATDELFLNVNWNLIASKPGYEFMGKKPLPKIEGPIVVIGGGNVSGDAAEFSKDMGVELKNIHWLYRGPASLMASLSSTYVNKVAKPIGITELTDPVEIVKDAFGKVAGVRIKKKVVTGFARRNGKLVPLVQGNNPNKLYRLPRGQSMEDVLASVETKGEIKIPHEEIEAIEHADNASSSQRIGFRLNTEDSEQDTEVIPAKLVFMAIGNFQEDLNEMDLSKDWVIGQQLTEKGAVSPTWDSIKQTGPKFVESIPTPDWLTGWRTERQIQKIGAITAEQVFSEMKKLKTANDVMNYFVHTFAYHRLLRTGQLDFFKAKLKEEFRQAFRNGSWAMQQGARQIFAFIDEQERKEKEHQKNEAVFKAQMKSQLGGILASFYSMTDPKEMLNLFKKDYFDDLVRADLLETFLIHLASKSADLGEKAGFKKGEKKILEFIEKEKVKLSPKLFFKLPAINPYVALGAILFFAILTAQGFGFDVGTGARQLANVGISTGLILALAVAYILQLLVASVLNKKVPLAKIFDRTNNPQESNRVRSIPLLKERIRRAKVFAKQI